MKDLEEFNLLIIAETGLGMNFIGSFAVDTGFVSTDFNEYILSNLRIFNKTGYAEDTFSNTNFIHSSHCLTYVDLKARYKKIITIEYPFEDCFDNGHYLSQFKHYSRKEEVEFDYIDYNAIYKMLDMDIYNNVCDIMQNLIPSYDMSESLSSLLIAYNYTKEKSNKPLKDYCMESLIQVFKAKRKRKQFVYDDILLSHSDKVYRLNYIEVFFNLNLPDFLKPHKEKIKEYSYKNIDILLTISKIIENKELEEKTIYFKKLLDNA